jgi:hypothetical protein
LAGLDVVAAMALATGVSDIAAARNTDEAEASAIFKWM